MTADTDGAVAPAGDTTPVDETAQVIDLDANPEESDENAAPDDGQPSGETEGAEPAEQPPIEPPKFWTKGAQEFFKSLPREMQETISQREHERDTEVRRTQNETADKLKGLGAREQAAEQVRQRLEHATAQALQSLANNNPYPDIQTEADVDKLSREDPLRYLEFKRYQEKVQNTVHQAQVLQQQRAQEQHQQFQTFAQEQDRLFIERNSEFANPEKAKQIRADVVLPYVRDVLGVSDQELAAFWNQPHIRDVRSQQALLDAARWRAAQAAAKKAQPAAKPAPQKPGTPAGNSGVPDLTKLSMEQYVAFRRKQGGVR